MNIDSSMQAGRDIAERGAYAPGNNVAKKKCKASDESTSEETCKASEQQFEPTILVISSKRKIKIYAKYHSTYWKQILVQPEDWRYQYQIDKGKEIERKHNVLYV